MPLICTGPSLGEVETVSLRLADMKLNQTEPIEVLILIGADIVRSTFHYRQAYILEVVAARVLRNRR